MSNDVPWSAVEAPAFGTYGTWEAANPECVAKGLATSSNTKMIQLLFASICACQVLFMASRAPRVTWEAVYLPFVETVLYGMASTGNGSMRLADGRMVPIARFCSWIITCPIMLFQVVGIHEVKVRGISCKNMVMAACLIRTVYGIGASVTLNPTMRWVQYFLSCLTFFFELWCVYQIYAAGFKKFSEVNTPLNNIVLTRMQLLRFLFYLSWTSFPIIWMLSSTGLCMIGEDSSVLAYLVADMICKNTYGIINANTLFRILNGKWVPETEEDAKNPRDTTRDNHVGETYIEQLFAGRGTATRRGSEGVPAGGNARDIELHVDRLPSFTPENAKVYSDKYYAQSNRLVNKAPEHFVDDKELPPLKSVDFNHDHRGSAEPYHDRRGSAEPYHDRRGSAEPYHDRRDSAPIADADRRDDRGRRGSSYEADERGRRERSVDPRRDSSRDARRDYSRERRDGSRDRMPLPNDVDRTPSSPRGRPPSPPRGRS